MKQINLLFFLFVALTIACCKPDDDLPDGNFPEAINTIIMKDCAVSGCHNDASHEAAGGLNLASWEKMFSASSGGSAVVPFNSDHSFLTYYINRDPNTGPALLPVMPYLRDPLSAEDVQMIRDWIDTGAPDKNGNIKFSNSTDPKLFLTNQGCDLVSVIDLATGRIARYIGVGLSSGVSEAPHNVKYNAATDQWYTVFIDGTANPNLEVYSGSDFSLAKRIDIGDGDWNTVTVTNDGNYAYVAAINKEAFGGAGPGTVAVVDLSAGQLLMYLSGAPTSHGTAVSPNGSRLYVTQQLGDDLTWFDLSDPSSPADPDVVDLDQWSPQASSFNTHEVMFTSDGTKYIVTCQGTDEVRIFNTSNDSLLAVIPVGNYPSEIAVSASFPYAFVTCMEDTNSFSGDPEKRGSVAVINTSTLTLETTVYAGYQPHGIVVDEGSQRCYVANRNTASTGPAPHHISGCGGRNGYLSFIDMTTLTVDPGYRMEVSVDPYSLAIKP